MTTPDAPSLRFVIPFRRAAWRAANPDVINCMRPGPFGNPFVPVDPKNPEHVRAAVEAFRRHLETELRITDAPALGEGYGWKWECSKSLCYSFDHSTPRWGDVQSIFPKMRDLIRELAKRDNSHDWEIFQAKQDTADGLSRATSFPENATRRFGCCCPLDAPACHRDPIIEYYLKCRKEHEANG